MSVINVQLAASNAISVQEDGRYLVNLADGTGLEFVDEAAFRDYIRAGAADPTSDTAKNAVLAILLGNLLAKDSLLDSLNEWNGKKIVLDVEQAIATNVLKII